MPQKAECVLHKSAINLAAPSCPRKAVFGPKCRIWYARVRAYVLSVLVDVSSKNIFLCLVEISEMLQPHL